MWSVTPLGCTLYNTYQTMSYPAVVNYCTANGGSLFTAAGPQDVLTFVNFTVNLGCENDLLEKYNIKLFALHSLFDNYYANKFQGQNVSLTKCPSMKVDFARSDC